MKPICALKLLLKKYINVFFPRFLISGFLNTCITYLIYLGVLLAFSYEVAYTVAFILGVFISYGLNANFVFRSGISIGSLIRFPLIYLLQYFFGIMMVAVLIEYGGVSDWLAPVFVIMVTVPLTFIFAKTIFLQSNRAGPDNASE